MSVQGINGGFGSAGIVPGLPRPQNAEGAATRRAERAQERAAAQAVESGAGAVPAEAPPGTDPALWSVLTGEERAFFARARAMGPLTYGPGSSNDSIPGVRLGGRIDVKV